MKFPAPMKILPPLKAWALVAILCFLATPLFAQVPVVTSSLDASGKMGAAFTYRIKASNNPKKFAATGLPAGLTLNATTGLISGTPTKSGTFKINISARNAKGISKTVILEVKVTKKETAKSNMVTVKGGTLPQGSGLAGQRVKTFQIGKYEVTWGEWKEVRAWAVANGYTDLVDIGSGTSADHPVQQVSWYDVVKWCNAKSQKEGLKPVYQVAGKTYKTSEYYPTLLNSANGYRLSTEAEWEWAARGGLKSKGYTYSGSNDVNAVAWYQYNSSGGSKMVGTKAANELGLYDMSGNVWEWCWNQAGNYYYDRRIRGGSWRYDFIFCRVDALTGCHDSAYDRESDTGFRLARNER